MCRIVQALFQSTKVVSRKGCKKLLPYKNFVQVGKESSLLANGKLWVNLQFMGLLRYP